jgi:hypothetical protein
MSHLNKLTRSQPLAASILGWSTAQSIKDVDTTPHNLIYIRPVPPSPHHPRSSHIPDGTNPIGPFHSFQLETKSARRLLPFPSLSLGEIELSPALVLYMDVADIRIEKWEDIDTWTSSRLPSLGLI